MNTLYITDLDGTLLTPEAILSASSAATLTDLMQQGLLFTVATARTPYTVVPILKALPISVPAILMNGVLLYDLSQKAILKTEYLGKDAAEKMLLIMKKHHLTGFLYSIQNGRLIVYYENLEDPARRKFHDERVSQYQKPFIHTDDFSALPAEEAVYYSVSGKPELLRPAADELSEISGLDFIYYEDIYHPDYWFLECFSHHANKYNALQYLRSRYGYEHVVGFGDNLNDLPLFAACDECCAVSGARNEVKEKATAVIGSNTENAVAQYIKSRYL